MARVVLCEGSTGAQGISGARGYLLKEADGLDIERAIDGVARGEAVFGAGIAERVLTFFTSRPASGRGTVPAAVAA